MLASNYLLGFFLILSSILITYGYCMNYINKYENKIKKKDYIYLEPSTIELQKTQLRVPRNMFELDQITSWGRTENYPNQSNL